jgi:hypothetical protein
MINNINNVNNIILEQNKYFEKSVIQDLYDKSIPYISFIQTYLKKNDIENYISGGFAMSLYNNNIKTNDVDSIIFVEKKVMNSKIIDIINTIIESSFKYYDTKVYNKNTKIYALLNFKNNAEIISIKNIIKSFGYKYYKYNNGNNDIFKLFFIKKIKKNYMKIIIKFKNNIELLKHNMYSYIKLNTFYMKKKKIINHYYPIDFVVCKKNISSDLIKNIFHYKINNKSYFVDIYNVKYLLYNLMYIFYNYKMKNKYTLNKLDNNKIDRNKTRLKYMLELYCYNINKNIDIDKLVEKFLKNIKKFKTNIFKIRNLNVIDKLIF